MTEQSNDITAAPAKRRRIAKAMARAGLCSRRDAETWIVAGRVAVNGKVLTSPACDVGENDVVLVDGAPLQSAEKTRLFLFHKPRGLVTSDRDPEGRPTVFEYLRENWPEGPRVITIGRLDINTEGLLLLTNDGGLARVLELPQTGWMRRYRVRAKGTADASMLDALSDGIRIAGIDYAGIEAKLDRIQGANCWLTVGLREGKNREVKRVLEYLGLEVNRLIRLSFGPFQLLDLPEGAVEEVRTRFLRDQLGPSLAAAAGVSFEGDEREKPKSAPRLAGGPKPLRNAPEHHRSKSVSERQRRPGLGEAPPPKRDRPVARKRKHISSLRAADHTAATEGPRRRIDRSNTQDRHARSVLVERMVATSLKRENQQDPQSSLSRSRNTKREAGRGHAARNERSERRESPSAEGKRQRIIRSGASRTERDPRDIKSSKSPPRRRTVNKPKPNDGIGRSRGGHSARVPRPKLSDKAHRPSRPKR